MVKSNKAGARPVCTGLIINHVGEAPDSHDGKLKTFHAMPHTYQFKAKGCHMEIFNKMNNTNGLQAQIFI